jgi:ribosomal protein S18 acetylase RimI-like enzyme
VPDEERLDNPVYAALSSAHAPFALFRGRARRYRADTAPFFALPAQPSGQDWRDAIELLAPGTTAAIIHAGVDVPEPWKPVREFEVVQMVAEHVSATEEQEAISLGAAEVPEILALVRETNPGPFLDRAIELGRYVGIRRDGVLVAVAGERLHLEGWTEISTVCTAPAHRGRGLASRLVATLSAGIESRAERPFLHVLGTNMNAIRVYERLGFSTRRRLRITALTHGVAP